jgi:pimeloyl-ACP methyl ester carboxylesterase
VVALHASASSPRQWDFYARGLPSGVRMQAPRLGLRPRPGDPAAAAGRGLDGEAARLWDEVGDEPVHLVGHSFGAAVALVMALQRPLRVVSATLYEPILFSVLRTAGPAHAWQEIDALARRVRVFVEGGRAEQGAQLFCDYWSGSGAWARMPAARREAVQARMDDVPWNFDALFGHAVGPDAFARLRMPIQVLCGQRSPEPARCCSEWVAGRCPDASLVRMSGAGHMAPVECPDRVLPFLPFAAASAVRAGVAS